MLANLIEYLEGIIESFGVWGVFAASFMEEVIAFLPSPVIMTASGFFLLDGPTSAQFFFLLFFTIAIPYAIGVTAGSFLFYGTLFFLGEGAVKKWGKWFGVYWEDIERLKGNMKNNYWDELSLLFFRIVPLIPSAALASMCGLVRMRLINYTLVTLLGVSIRASIFAFFGWYLGETYQKYATTIAGVESLIGYIFLFLIVCLFVFAFIYTQGRRRKDML